MGFRRATGLGKVALVLLCTLALALVLGEGLVRVLYPDGPTYYTGRLLTANTRAFPFGRIHTNREGYPDLEWGAKDRPRVGWLGDSVVYGIGVGQGHRFTDRLRWLAPEHEHLNLGSPGYQGPRRGSRGATVMEARRLRVDHLVYVLNLNDIEPVGGAALEEARFAPPARRPSPTWRRIREGSYFLTVLHERQRQAAQPIARDRVFGLFPNQHHGLTGALVGEVRALQRLLAREGIALSVALLPVEMQVSSEAEAFYAQRGVVWEEGLVEGTAQEALLDALGPEITAVDLRWAFLDPQDPRGSRENTRMCDWFVCTDGGALDWNHLDRSGHRVVAELLAGSEILATPSVQVSSAQ